MKGIYTAVLGIVFTLTACSGAIPATPFPLPESTSSVLPPRTSLDQTQDKPVFAQPTLSPTETITPSPSPSPSPTPTEAWITQGPGDVTVPILLYHRIDTSPIDSRYYVKPEKFDAQMKLLHDWGYTSITTSMLIEAITQGRELPPRPFLLTIDDGHLDNYTNAFPITQKYGFAGALYIVGYYLGAEDFMNVDQILEMHDAGWEVGSHSLDHLDLTTLEPDALRNEIVGSREFLEEKLGVPILTFAYPFGFKNEAAVDYVKFAGYIGAMGASGYTPAQGLWNLYYLQRIEIKGREDANTFTRFLPWQGAPPYLPADTSTAIPKPPGAP